MNGNSVDSSQDQMCIIYAEKYPHRLKRNIEDKYWCPDSIRKWQTQSPLSPLDGPCSPLYAPLKYHLLGTGTPVLEHCIFTWTLHIHSLIRPQTNRDLMAWFQDKVSDPAMWLPRPHNLHYHTAMSKINRCENFIYNICLQSLLQSSKLGALVKSGQRQDSTLVPRCCPEKLQLDAPTWAVYFMSQDPQKVLQVNLYG